MSEFEHRCERSDVAEDTLQNVAALIRYSGENRARLGYPVSWRVRALRLLGDHRRAQEVADRHAGLLPAGEVVSIPTPRKPHPAEARLVMRAIAAQAQRGR